MQQEQQFSYCENYRIIGKLDEGGQGKVKIGVFENERVAIKLFKSDYTMLREQEILEKLKHPNIIKMLDSKFKGQYKKKNGTILQRSFIVFELSEAGELYYFIKSSGRLSEDICRYYSKQIIEALFLMKQQQICHRDLKLNNIVLDAEYNIKIIDFGQAKYTNNLRTERETVGTQSYQAPEILNGQLYNGFEIDVFSTGVILFILYVGRLPFREAKPDYQQFKLLIENKQEKFWLNHSKNSNNLLFSPEFKNLIDGMIHPNPNVRLTIEQCLQHPWLQGQMATHQQIMQEFTKRQNSATQANEQNRAKEKKKKFEQLQEQQLRVGLDRPIGKFNSASQHLIDKYQEIKQRYNLQFDNRKLQDGFITNKLYEIVSFHDAQDIYCQILQESELFGGKVNKIYENKYKINFDIFDCEEKIFDIQVELQRLEDDGIVVKVFRKGQEHFNFYETKETIGRIVKLLDE